ncbi:metallophosphoesterase [Bacillus timonensis]|nr:metallophosphoesterase [Bacillus timonensis]
MRKILIVSDSHGLTEELTRIKNRHRDEVEYMIHCGDSELEKSSSEMEDFLAVKGNCDYDSLYDNELICAFENEKVFATHGHLFQVNMTLMNIKYRAEELGATIVCFGHSHIAGAEYIDNILFVNPGSIFLPKMRKEKTYAIIEKVNNNLSVRYYDLEGKELPTLSLVQ